MLKRLALLPAAASLGLFAGWAGFEATRLPHTGAWTMQLSATILAAAAISLLGRQLWAYVFGMLFWLASALGCGALAAFVGWEALTHSSGGEWAGVRGLVLGMVTLGALAIGAMSATLGTTLWAAWRGLAPARSALSWALSAVLALGSIGLVGWLGYQYWHRQLPRQNECLSGKGLVCYALANDRDHFQTAERQAFARRGCESGDDSSCRVLAVFLDASHSASSPEVRALDARCQAGRPDTCERLGVHMLRRGDRETGARYLEQTCTLEVRRCDSAARAAQEGGQPDLSLRLLERGCGKDDASSCRALRRQLLGGAHDPALVADLEWKTCLIGDVNDCMPMIRRDLRGVCPRICSGATESLMHTCGHCAREAVAKGERGLAEVWLAGTCSRGYSWSCRDLAELRLSSDRPAQVTR